MSQFNFEIPNQGFPSMRADINDALQALASNSSGTTAPTTTYPNQFWYETDTNILHIRNEGDTAWLDLMVINGTTGSPSFNSGNVGIGTTDPSQALHVVGNVKMESSSPNFLFIGTTNPTNTDARIRLNSSGNLLFETLNNDETLNRLNLTLESDGDLILAGSVAQKLTGTTWSNPSDQRLKSNITNYSKGIPELMQVRVCEWEYNGKGGTTEGMKGIGVIADEVMTILPNTVDTYDAKLNAEDKETTSIKKFDATEITWLLVKAVQEQQAIINSFEARLAALEGKTG